MRTLTIQIDDHDARCELRHGALTHQAVLPMEHVTSWGNLLQQVKDALALDLRPPPGLLTQADVDESGPLPRSNVAQPWQARHFTGMSAEGWAWGFYYTGLFDGKTEQFETCCGFISRVAAERAARNLRTNLDRLSGDWPNASFEVFRLDEAFAFLDSSGEIHATFPTAGAAFSAAAKHQHQLPAPHASA